MKPFAALADETRLAIVDELSKGERAVGDLVARFDLRQPTISQHLKVLKEAGLVRARPDAQRRLYSIDPQGFRVVELWLDRHRRMWAKHLDALEQHMDRNPERSK
ncbi:MAG: ArsR/SmtB family transcription factor [Acidimicrobiia bacterium]